MKFSFEPRPESRSNPEMCTKNHKFFIRISQEDSPCGYALTIGHGHGISFLADRLSLDETQELKKRFLKLLDLFDEEKIEGSDLNSFLHFARVDHEAEAYCEWLEIVEDTIKILTKSGVLHG